MKRVNAAISPSKRTEEEGLSLVIDAQQKKLKPAKQEAIKSLVSLNVFKPLRRNSEKMSRNNKSSHHANYALSLDTSCIKMLHKCSVYLLVFHKVFR